MLRVGAFITPTLRLVRPLGEGGMGRVWIADHLGLCTQVVVKFLSEQLAENEEAKLRFSREAAAASQVKSPHVVHMIDYGITADGTPYIAMELLEGKDLYELLVQYGSLSPEGVAKIVTQVARALMRAHEKAIVHRDLKPQNIFLIDAGGGEVFAKVLDFGVAKAPIAETGRTTGSGAVLGTPVYMSPEQILGSKAIDHRSDLWSLGVVAFEALTGTLPFDGETVGAISVAICHGPMPRPSQRNHAIGPSVDAWFRKACARDVAERFESAKQMAEALGAAVIEDAASEDEETRLMRGRRMPLPPVSPTKATPTMLEMFEQTIERRTGRSTTNGAISQGPIAASTSAPRSLAPRRIAIVTAVVATLAGVVALVVNRTGDHPTDVHPVDSVVPREEAASTQKPKPTTTSVLVESSTPTIAPNEPAPAPSTDTAFKPQPAPVSSSTPKQSPTAASIAAPPVAVPTTAAPPKPKRKGSDVVIE